MSKPELNSDLDQLQDEARQAREAAQAEPTPARLEALAKAERALALAEAAEGDELVLANKRQVHRYLAGLGYKLSETTVYNHATEGFLRPAEDGLFHEKQIRAYLKAKGLRPVAEAAAVDTEDELARRKRLAEVKRAEAEAKRAAAKADEYVGSLVPRNELEHRLTARAYLLKTDLMTLAQSAAPEILALTAGDPDTLPDLAEWLRGRFEEFLDRYARPGDFTVEVPEA